MIAIATLSFVGIKQFDSSDALQIKTVVQRYQQKLQRTLPQHKLTVHTKVYRTKGKQKYSFHSRLISPKARFASEASDWDLTRTVHKVMKKLENSVNKHQKTEGQQQEKYHPKRAKRGTNTRIKLRR